MKAEIWKRSHFSAFIIHLSKRIWVFFSRLLASVVFLKFVEEVQTMAAA